MFEAPVFCCFHVYLSKSKLSFQISYCELLAVVHVKYVWAYNRNPYEPVGTMLFQTPGRRLLKLFDANKLEISAPFWPTRVSIWEWRGARCCGPSKCRIGRCHCHWNFALLPVIFHIHDRAGSMYFSLPVEKVSQVGLKSHSSDLISRGIQINSGEEADEATSECTGTVASACRWMTCHQWSWFETGSEVCWTDRYAKLH